MKVNQALILAGGTGSRLGLNTKSHLLYKKKIVLEYLVESCVKANIDNIVVVLVPKKLERKIEKKKLIRLKILIKNYPKIKFIRGSNLSFRETPNEVRSHLNVNKPFFILCGQSPQTSNHLINMSRAYRKNLIITSGYRYRRDYIVSIGKIKKNKVVSFQNIEFTKPRKFVAGSTELITHFPYIIDFTFYDNYIKKDKYKQRFEFYLNSHLKKGGEIRLLKNPVQISEVDYKIDLPELYASIDYLIDNDYR
jgi:NDP-sugar pyrophosphorylase family protein